MATRRASKKTAKTGDGKALMSVAEMKKQLAQKATQAADNVQAGGGNVISTRNGKLSYRGEDLGKEIDVIVLGFVAMNTYYIMPWNADDMRAPTCFAVGEDVHELEPHAEVRIAQSDEGCAKCWANDFGSDPRGGRGKACQNRYKLAVISAWDVMDEDGNVLDSAADAPIATLTISPSGVSSFGAYVKKCKNTYELHPSAFLTKVTMIEEDTYAWPQCSIEEELSDEALTAIFPRIAEAEETLGNVDQFTSLPEEEEPKPRAKRAAKKKTAARK